MKNNSRKGKLTNADVKIGAEVYELHELTSPEIKIIEDTLNYETGIC